MNKRPSIGDKFAYFALIAFEKPIGWIPTSWMWRIGAGVGFLAYHLVKKRTAIVQANLKIVHPDLDDQEIDTLTRQVFRKSFGNLISSVNTGFIPFKKVQQIVTIKDQHHFKNIGEDKGCIMLLFHMGNWEILTRVAHMIDIKKPSGAMYRPLNNVLVNDYITKSREKDGTQLFGRKKGLILATKFIRDGGMLGILADQHSGKAGIDLPLFGRETSITPLPSMLAQKYDCPVIPVTVVTSSPGKWDISFNEPISIPKSLSKEEATQLLIPAMEKVMIENSSDIFWLHDRWKLKREL